MPHPPRHPTIFGVPVPASLPLILAAQAPAGLVARGERVDGDASDDRVAPSSFATIAGSDPVRGALGISANSDAHDPDDLLLEVPERHELAEFRLVDAFVGGALSFVAIEAGPIITMPADGTSVESPLLGWARFGSVSIGTDPLPEMGVAPGAVAAATCPRWLMELNTGETDIDSFPLVVTPVPEPGRSCSSVSPASPGRGAAGSARLSSRSEA